MTKPRKTICVKQLLASDLPPALRPYWENVKDNEPMRMAVLLTALVCYCSLSARLRVKYPYDMTDNMLLLNLLVIGRSGKGKSVIRHVVDDLTLPLKLRDQEERRKLREWKDENNARGANKDKTEEPLVAIRHLQQFTLPVIVKYADFMHRRYRDWMTFFLYGDELAAFVENRRKCGEFQAVARTAYSLGETYSRDTLYAQGYNAVVDIDWCSVICGQEQALDTYIDKKGVLAGDAGRQMLVKLSDGLAENAPTLLPFSDTQLKAIHEAQALLMRETYTDRDELQPVHQVPMQWMDKDVYRWCEQTRDVILMSGSNAMDSFYVRASLSAHRACTMMYHLWGEDPASQNKVRRCYYYLAQYILDTNMLQWGTTYEAGVAKPKEVRLQTPCLYEQVPQRFSRDQLQQVINKLELSSPARVFIGKWKDKKWIYEPEPDVYEKIY